MLQMSRLARDADFVVLACAEDSFAVLGCHRAADHGHCFADLHYDGVDADCGAFWKETQVRRVGNWKELGG